MGRKISSNLVLLNSVEVLNNCHYIKNIGCGEKDSNRLKFHVEFGDVLFLSIAQLVTNDGNATNKYGNTLDNVSKMTTKTET